MSLDQFNAPLKKKYSFLKNILLSLTFEGYTQKYIYLQKYLKHCFTCAETVKKTFKSGQTEIRIFFPPNNSRCMIKHNISCSTT